MKKILVMFGVFILGCLSVVAYTPSTDLVEKMDEVIQAFEDIIDTKGESYRGNILSAIDVYKDRYSDDERITYILEYIYEDLSESHDHSISQEYMGSYSINDEEYGTQVEVVVSGDSRSMSANALPNHETGDFPNSGNPNTISAQSKDYNLDTNPTYIGDAVWAKDSGVAYNGVKFELETAERVECSSGEVYKIEAIQDLTDLGLDHNHAHVQPTGEYHYHGAAVDLIATLDGDDIVHVGFASDGFPIYYSKDGTYAASYGLVDEPRVGTSCSYRNKSVTVDGTTPDGDYVSDWEYDASGDLDACNGIEIDGEYVYFITDEYPYGPRCMNGDYADSGVPGGGAGGQMGPPPRR